MRLLIEYEVVSFDELEEEWIFQHRKTSVKVREDLPKSNWLDFVKLNYYQIIKNLEEDCTNFCLKDVVIESVEYLEELECLMPKIENA